MNKIDELILACRQVGRTWVNYNALRMELEKPTLRLKLSDDGELMVNSNFDIPT